MEDPDEWSRFCSAFCPRNVIPMSALTPACQELWRKHSNEKAAEKRRKLKDEASEGADEGETALCANHRIPKPVPDPPEVVAALAGHPPEDVANGTDGGGPPQTFATESPSFADDEGAGEGGGGRRLPPWWLPEFDDLGFLVPDSWSPVPEDDDKENDDKNPNVES